MVEWSAAGYRLRVMMGLETRVQIWVRICALGYGLVYGSGHGVRHVFGLGQESQYGLGLGYP